LHLVKKSGAEAPLSHLPVAGIDYQLPENEIEYLCTKLPP
jgi:hypothetical protein